MLVHRPSRLASAVVPLALVVLGAACGSSGTDSSADTTGAATTATTAAGSAAGTGAASDVAAADAEYCVAALALDTDPGPDIDFATASPEEIAAGIQSYAGDTLRPLFEDLEAVAPPELDDEVQTFGAAIDSVIDTGDPSAFESPELAAADESSHAYDLEHCGYEQVDVTATNYQYSGVEAVYAAGPVSFELTNEGPEVHEMVLLKIKPGVNQTAEDLLALPESESRSKIEVVNTIGPVEPGGSDHMVADLDNGRYVVACFLPEGSTSMQALETADGAPHSSLGMFRAVSVS